MLRKFPALCSHERMPVMSVHSHRAGPQGKGQSKLVSHLVSCNTLHLTFFNPEHSVSHELNHAMMMMIVVIKQLSCEDDDFLIGPILVREH